MKTYKWATPENLVVMQFDGDGLCRVSGLRSAFPEDITIEPADPLPPPVYTCSPWQIRKALNERGLRQAVEDAVAASDNQTLKDGWEFATQFNSNDPFVIAMGAELGMTEEQTAELIQYASAL